MDTGTSGPAPPPPSPTGPGGAVSPPPPIAPPMAAGPPVMARPPRGGPDLVVIVLVTIVVVAALAFVAGATVIGRAWWLHRAQRYDDEITWLQSIRSMAPIDLGLDGEIARAYRERVRRELDAGRLAPAVQAFRVARAEAMANRRGIDRDLMALGIESYTRAADHVEKIGNLSGAADWDDSLFVLAIRAPEPHHRFAAVAAFQEALDLRVRDGKPCAALARIQWAQRGLHGPVPGLPAWTESDLQKRCDASRRGR